MGFRRVRSAWFELASLGALALAIAVPSALRAQAPAAPAAAHPQAQPQAAPASIAVSLRPDQVALIVKVLSEVEADGFRKGEFAPADLGRMLASQDPAERARGAAFLGPGAVRYAEAQHGGRMQGKRFLSDWSIRPEAYAAGTGFAQAAASDKLADWFAAQPPPYQGYLTLREALAHYRGLAATGGWKTIAGADKSLKPGEEDARVPLLRERLAVEDAETPAASDPMRPNLFDQGLADALGRFQQRHGLNPDGAMGKGTLAELNVPADRRVGAILANMERWRWLPRAAPANRIEVNIAAQTLEYYHDSKLAAFMRTVAGRKTDKTPMLRSNIHSIVLNPPWNVPTSIATKELWPKAKADPGYFASENIIVKENGGLQQLPGPKNSLGQIKFDFVNTYGVYLHGTPAQAAFGRDMRAVSHGCVRLERPLDLARALLNDDPNWQAERIDATLQSGDTTRARLPQSMPVYLLYWTVFQDAKGQLNFRNDLYDWDKSLLGLLDAGQKRA